MFSTSSNSSAQRTSSNAGAMEAKIHGMADSLRRQRDEAHRKSLTAAERVRLVQQEAEAMAATVDNMQNQYKTLQEKAAQAKEVETLATQVQEKTQQFQFQHAQLVQKRDKSIDMQRRFEQSQKRRESSKRKIEQVIANRQRYKISFAGDDDNKTAALELEISQDCDGRLLEIWPVVIRAKTRQLQERDEMGKLQNQVLQRVADGYRTKLQLVPRNETNHDQDAQEPQPEEEVEDQVNVENIPVPHQPYREQMHSDTVTKTLGGYPSPQKTTDQQSLVHAKDPLDESVAGMVESVATNEVASSTVPGTTLEETTNTLSNASFQQPTVSE